VGASRSLRRRGAERETTGESEGSVHAGGFLDFNIGFGGGGGCEGCEDDDSASDSDSGPLASSSSWSLTGSSSLSL